MVGELHREDRVHVEAVELEGEHRTLITDIPGHHVRLYCRARPVLDETFICDPSPEQVADATATLVFVDDGVVDDGEGATSMSHDHPGDV